MRRGSMRIGDARSGNNSAASETRTCTCAARRAIPWSLRTGGAGSLCPIRRHVCFRHMLSFSTASADAHARCRARAGAFPQVAVAIGVLLGTPLATLPCAFASGDHHMKTHARVVVIGGGVVGVSTLYHLALKGWTRRGAARARRAHRRLDLARGGPAAAVQHELHGRTAAQVLGGPLQAPAGRDRPGCELPRHRQSAPRHLPRAHGRVSEVLRHRQHHRRALPDHHARRGARSSGRWSSSATAPRPPNIVGALYHPDDGHIAPADLTMALRKGARAARRRDPRADRSHGASSARPPANGT